MGRRRKPPEEHKPSGRPTRLANDDERERFLSFLRAGSWISEAAEAVPWPVKTVEDWLARGRQSVARVAEAEALGGPTPGLDEPWHSFAVEVDQTIAAAEVMLLGLIRRAAGGVAAREDGTPGVRPDWKAAAWLLEKKNPKRYGQRVTVGGDPEAPMVVMPVVPGLSEAEREQRAAEVVAALAGLGADPVLDRLPVEDLIEPA